MHHKCGDCSWFRDGYCRKLRQPTGFFTIACDDFALGTADTAPATKVCSDCGRELPIDSFAHHARTLDGHQPICRECMRSRLKGRRKTPKAPKAVTPPSVDEILDGLIPNTSTSAPGKAAPKYVQTRSTEDLDDIEIIDELRRRGWTGEIYKKYQL